MNALTQEALPAALAQRLTDEQRQAIRRIYFLDDNRSIEQLSKEGLLP